MNKINEALMFTPKREARLNVKYYSSLFLKPTSEVSSALFISLEGK